MIVGGGGAGLRAALEDMEFFQLPHRPVRARHPAVGGGTRRRSPISPYRDEIPERDDEAWLRHALAWVADGTVKLSSKPVRLGTYEPAPRVY